MCAFRWLLARLDQHYNWCSNHPSEKYERSVGISLFPTYGKIKHVPNHQPGHIWVCSKWKGNLQSTGHIGHMRKINTIVRIHGTMGGQRMGFGGHPTSIRMAVDDYHFAKELPGNVDDSPILPSHLGV